MINPNSQAGELLLHFQGGGSINRLQALVKYGIAELSARIIDIERHGFVINKKHVTYTKANGKIAHGVEYSLKVE